MHFDHFGSKKTSLLEKIDHDLMAIEKLLLSLDGVAPRLANLVKHNLEIGRPRHPLVEQAQQDIHHDEAASPSNSSRAKNNYQ